MVDLWIMQSRRYVDIALEEGLRQFTVQTGSMMKTQNEELSWMRAHTAAYGPVKVMIIDHAGAAEYSTFGNYTRPLAVYPTWAAEDEPWETLIWLLENPVGENEQFCDDPKILPEHRPVKGQKHRVVVHRLPKPGPERQLFMLKMRQVQIDYPDAELFISGCKRFNDLFGIGLKAVDFWPEPVTLSGSFTQRVMLPTGRILTLDRIWDKRYADWFDLIGFDQSDVVTQDDMIRFCIRSGMWANKNFGSIKPFVSPSTRGGGNNTVFMEAELITTPESHFILPAARRTMMRNLGIKATDADKFTCDGCILQNACTLYRAGSVCTLKGSEAVALSDAFGSRNVDVLLGGLSQLLKKNAERLDDAMATEAQDEDGKLDPEVTKLSKTVFDQATKLVKLIDPNLAGGPKIQVNVGVGAGGHAQINAGTDPKQLMATIVAELEASGIPREDIDSTMVKGVLRNMAQVGQEQAISTAKVQNEMAKAGPKVIEA
jgi:hypothetical protein